MINDLFSQKVSPVITLKWKEKEDMTSYLIENQPMCIKEIDVSGSNKMIQLQCYQKGECGLYSV
jgi:hypothetical protein